MKKLVFALVCVLSLALAGNAATVVKSKTPVKKEAPAATNVKKKLTTKKATTKKNMKAPLKPVTQAAPVKK
ncbi:MAG: hypothetical protein WC384_09390 [Prolixibacteraceae bacterium]|jgi:phosphate-selective porin